MFKTSIISCFRHFLIFISLLYGSNTSVIAQQKITDSLLKSISVGGEDSIQVNALNNLAYEYLYSNPDSCYYYATKALMLSEKLMYQEGVIMSNENIAFTFVIAGNYSKALSLLLEALKMSETINYVKGKELAYVGLASLYGYQNDERKSIEYNQKCIAEAKIIQDQYWIRAALTNISISYLALNMPDSALYYTNLVYKEYSQTNDRMGIARSLGILANIYLKKGDHQSAMQYLRQSLSGLSDDTDGYLILYGYLEIAEIFQKQNQVDSALYYATRSWQVSNNIGLLAGKIAATGFLARHYKSKNNTDSAFKYLELNMELKDSLFNQEKNRDFENLTMAENMRQLEIQQAEKKAQNEFETRLKFYGLLAGMAILVIVALFLVRNAKQQKASKSKIELAYNELKSTQSQLIQSEKMASLGELTAGIAHEIQNPLNFVNNFSEVNKELVDELQQELKAGKIDDAIAISNDIKENEQKINHHGKRADAIVKGMLQHSRSSSGQKEPTDINALADEYLRLSYHGFRAKDNSFNATIKTDFDKSVGNINIIPQDIGRVILNLITNAFYAVGEKKKEQYEGYEPTVSVSTKKVNEKIEIKVGDNGNGIPQKVVDKIFQPFFTTKPTGQGTGLGLSLSYDIIKAHGGEIKVHTSEGEGTEFIIQLPVV